METVNAKVEHDNLIGKFTPHTSLGLANFLFQCVFMGQENKAFLRQGKEKRMSKDFLYQCGTAKDHLFRSFTAIFHGIHLIVVDVKG